MLYKSLVKSWFGHAAPEIVLASNVLVDVKKTLDNLGLAEVLCIARCPRSADSAGYRGSAGSIFLDIFKKEARPLHDNNVAMLYVVGPRGKGCKESKSQHYKIAPGGASKVHPPLEDKVSFLTSIAELSKNAMDLIHEYNVNVARFPNLPKVYEVRWSLVSGGVYMHEDATKMDVAQATIRGMARSDCCNVNVKMMYDDDIFRLAYK